MQDYIGDMLTRIRNGYQARLDRIKLGPFMPKYVINILDILWEEGFIRGYQESYNKKTKLKEIEILLKYDIEGSPGIQEIFRVSKPGRKIYVSIKALWKPKSVNGIFILSTPRGFLIDRDARLFNVGGEVICGLY